ncbi:MarR family transcriptional regulator, partial [Candidatus Nomurabacteria bacterium]|nr:MarR family transcriptional regulator [Candidatus Nomurabacteria bacterium]
MKRNEHDRDDFEFALPDENVPLPILLKHTERAVGSVIRGHLEQLGMKRSFGPVLMVISRREGMTQNELAVHMHVTAPTISVVIRNMEDNGLVEKKCDTGDQRQFKLYMTEKGRQLWDKTDRIFAAVNDSLLSCLEGGEEKLLRRLNDEALPDARRKALA